MEASSPVPSGRARGCSPRRRGAAAMAAVAEAEAEAEAEAAADLGECAELGSALPPICCLLYPLPVALVAATRYWLMVQ